MKSGLNKEEWKRTFKTLESVDIINSSAGVLVETVFPSRGIPECAFLN